MASRASGLGRWGAAALVVATLVVAATPLGASAAVPKPQTTALVSASAVGLPVQADDASVSADGQFVAFVANLDGLTEVPTGDWAQVYVKNMETGAVELVSADHSDSGKAGNESSRLPSISADGHFVAFMTNATNVAEGISPTNGHSQIVVRDLRTGAARLVSLNSAGSDGGNASSGSPSISADGSSVAFQSRATDLVPQSTRGVTQVYLASVATSAITLVSLSPVDGMAANEDVGQPSVSADGEYVAFGSEATNLTREATHGIEQVYRRSMRDGAIDLVSAGDSGGGAEGWSSGPTISADGAVIAYVSSSKDLGDVTLPAGSSIQIWVRSLSGDRESTLASVGADGVSPGDYDSTEPKISDDGRLLAFTSMARNLGGAPGRGYQVFARDLVASSTAVVSAPIGAPSDGASETAYHPSISGDGRFVAFRARALDLVDAPPPAGDYVYLRALDYPRVDRIGGVDRYAVSAAISAEHVRPPVARVYVASGEVFADALSGSAAAGTKGAPVLLVQRDMVPATVDAELKRLRPREIVVLGGPMSVSAEVERQLRGYSPVVSRIGGADRYVVAAAVSKSAFPVGTPTVYVASGEVFADALSGSAAAGVKGAPVLLTQRGTLPAAVVEEVKRLQPSRIIVLGGSVTIADSVVAELNALKPTTRIAGADRFAVSASVSADAFPSGAKTVYVASGAIYPDALSGAAAAVIRKAPVLLVNASSIPTAIATELTRLKPSHIVVLGGPNTVNDAVLTELQAFLSK